MRHTQADNNPFVQPDRSKIADQTAEEQTRESAENCAEQRADNCEKHLPSLTTSGGQKIDQGASSTIGLNRTGEASGGTQLVADVRVFFGDNALAVHRNELRHCLADERNTTVDGHTNVIDAAVVHRLELQ